MAKLSFYLQSKNPQAPIYARLRDGVIDAKAKTNLFINPEDWSEKKKMPKSLKDADAKFIQQKMLDMRHIVTKAFNSRASTTIINSDWLYSVLFPKEETVKDSTVETYFDIYYESKLSMGCSEALLKKIISVKNLFIRYQKDRNSIFLIRDITVAVMDDFAKYMISKKYRQSYVFRVVKQIKSILFDAKATGYETSNNFEQIRQKDKKSYKTYLSIQEIHQIIETEMPHDYLDNAKDWLIISCYLGQRVSDLMRCEKSMIRITDEGRVIDLTQKKTKTEMMVAIFPEVDKILDKRDGDFPRPISDQKYNEYIKEVCRLAGLNSLEKGKLYDATQKREMDGKYEKWRLISSHVGRRSFATNYYGIYPTTLLMAQTGHTTERAFREYIGKGQIDQINQLLKMVNK